MHSLLFVLINKLLMVVSDQIVVPEVWSHPACWETTGIKGTPEQDTLYRDIFVFGDVHGTRGGLMMLLNAAGIVEGDSCIWNGKKSSVLLIQMGDVVDRGKFSTESYACLTSLQQTAPASSSRVVRLLGNHELLWLSGETNYRNKEADTPDKINSLTKQIIVDVIRGNVQGAFDLTHFRNIPMLLTHAGLRVKMRTLIESAILPAQENPNLIRNASLFASYIQ
jgi:hypothetical protein